MYLLVWHSKRDNEVVPCLVLLAERAAAEPPACIGLVHTTVQAFMMKFYFTIYTYMAQLFRKSFPEKMCRKQRS